MARLSDKLGEIVVTSNPQTAGLAGEIRPFAGDTSAWPVIDGVRQLKGWAVCEGNILEQTDYPDLFENIGSTWDSFNHPNGQTGTVGDEQFRLPKLAGLYLGGAGANGVSTLTLGSFADDRTNVNRLSTSSSSISGSAVNGGSHTHTISGHRESKTPQGGFAQAFISQNDDTGGQPTRTLTTNTGQGAHSHTLSGTAAAQDLSGDAETRPKTAPVSYIIALYNNLANVVSTKDLTASNVTVTGGLTTDSVSATTYSGLPVADGSTDGIITTGAQTIAGNKTFNNDVTVVGPLNFTDSSGVVSASSPFVIFTIPLNVDQGYRIEVIAFAGSGVNSAHVMAIARQRSSDNSKAVFTYGGATFSLVWNGQDLQVTSSNANATSFRYVITRIY